MLTALVTGAAGFTGRYMARSLKSAGYRVVGLGSGADIADEMLLCDLTKPDEISDVVAKVKPDVVVHLAALAFVGGPDQKAFYDVNVFGTQFLLEAILRHVPGIQKVLLASSANVYGNPNISVLDESVVPAPVNHYAISKLAMEHIAKTYFEKLPIILTRPFNYTGPGQDGKFLIPKIVHHFAEHAERIELGNINVSRDFSDVRYIVEVYTRLLSSSFEKDIVNVCSGQVYSLSEIISMMERIVGYKIAVEINPAFVRKNEIAVLKGTNAKLASVIALPPQLDMEQLLNDMYSMYLSSKN